MTDDDQPDVALPSKQQSQNGTNDTSPQDNDKNNIIVPTETEVKATTTEDVSAPQPLSSDTKPTTVVVTPADEAADEANPPAPLPMEASAEMPPLQRPLTDPLSPAARAADDGNGVENHDNHDATATATATTTADDENNNNSNNDNDEPIIAAASTPSKSTPTPAAVIGSPTSNNGGTITMSDSRSTVVTDIDSSYGSDNGGNNESQRASFRLDRWGNMIVGDEAVARPSLRLERDRIRRDTSRENKWLRMIQNWERFKAKNPDKVKERIRKGIPDSMRATIWPTLTGARDQLAQSRKLYSQLLRQTSEFEAVIGRDINRTFPRHVLFRKNDNLEDDVMALEHKDKINESKGQGSLFNVCKCYSIYDPEVGYCQGMGFVAGLLLMYMSEEEAFWNMERIMRGDKFRLRTLFLPGFPLLRQFFYQLTHLMNWYLPALSRHFNEQGLMPDLYATQWFLTLYARTFPTELVLRIWDIFLHEGIKIVFRVALYILKAKCKVLLTMDIGGIMPVLQNIQNDPIFADADTFMAGVMNVPLSRKRLAKLEKAYLAEQAAATMNT